jgi:hypothetical protein
MGSEVGSEEKDAAKLYAKSRAPLVSEGKSTAEGASGIRLPQADTGESLLSSLPWRDAEGDVHYGL